MSDTTRLSGLRRTGRVLGTASLWLARQIINPAMLIPIMVLLLTWLGFQQNAALYRRAVLASHWYDATTITALLLPPLIGHLAAWFSGHRSGAWWMLWIPAVALYWLRPWHTGTDWAFFWREHLNAWDHFVDILRLQEQAPLRSFIRLGGILTMAMVSFMVLARSWLRLAARLKDMGRDAGEGTAVGGGGAGKAEGLPQATWASTSEVRRQFSHKGGIVLGEHTDPLERTPDFDPDTPRSWNGQGKGRLITMNPARGNGHVVVLAASAGYKTAGIVIPNILHYDDPLVVIDPKGDLYARTRDARKAMGFEARVIDARHGFDPFRMIAPLAPEAPSVYLTMARTLMPLGERASDISEYFHDMSTTLFAALMGHFISENSDNVARDISTFINREREEVIDEARDIAARYDFPFISDELEGLAALDERTFPGVVKGISNKLAFTRFPDIAAYGQSSESPEAHLAALGPKSDIFINFPAQAAEDFSSFPRLLIGAIYVASELTEQPDRPRARRLFLVDEARVLGGTSALNTIRDAGRSLGLHLMLIYQNYGQLTTAWGGESGAAAWLDSCEARVISAVGSSRTANDIVTMLGRRTLRTRVQGSSASSPVMTPMGGSVSSSEQEQIREVALMSASALGQLPAHGALIFTRRTKPILATKAIFFTRDGMAARVRSPDAVTSELEATQRRDAVMKRMRDQKLKDLPDPQPGLRRRTMSGHQDDIEEAMPYETKERDTPRPDEMAQQVDPSGPHLNPDWEDASSSGQNTDAFHHLGTTPPDTGKTAAPEADRVRASEASKMNASETGRIDASVSGDDTSVPDFRARNRRRIAAALAEKARRKQAKKTAQPSTTPGKDDAKEEATQIASEPKKPAPPKSDAGQDAGTEPFPDPGMKTRQAALREQEDVEAEIQPEDAAVTGHEAIADEDHRQTTARTGGPSQESTTSGTDDAANASAPDETGLEQVDDAYEAAMDLEADPDMEPQYAAFEGEMDAGGTEAFRPDPAIGPDDPQPVAFDQVHDPEDTSGGGYDLTDEDHVDMADIMGFLARRPVLRAALAHALRDETEQMVGSGPDAEDMTPGEDISENGPAGDARPKVVPDIAPPEEAVDTAEQEHTGTTDADEDSANQVDEPGATPEDPDPTEPAQQADPARQVRNNTEPEDDFSKLAIDAAIDMLWVEKLDIPPARGSRTDPETGSANATDKDPDPEDTRTDAAVNAEPGRDAEASSKPDAPTDPAPVAKTKEPRKAKPGPAGPKRRKSATRDDPVARRRRALKAAEVRDAFDPHIEEFFRDRFGEPARPGAADWRPKDRGGFSLCVRGEKRGQWYDHHAGHGGWLFDLIAVELCNLPDAKADFPRVLEAAADYIGFSPANETPQTRKARQERKEKRDRKAQAEDRRRAEDTALLVLALKGLAQPVAGSPAEAYLAQRHITEYPETGLAFLPPLDTHLPPSLLDHVHSPDHPALVVWATNEAGTVTGGQRILLDATGQPASVTPGKPCFGTVSGAPARFPARDGATKGPLLVAEGPESALSLRVATGFESWAVFGVSNWLSAPLPRDREIILAPDRDAPDSPAGKAFRKAVAHHLAKGCRLALAPAPEPEGSKKDLNDTLMDRGADGVRAALDSAHPPGPEDLPMEDDPQTQPSGGQTEGNSEDNEEDVETDDEHPTGRSGPGGET